MKIIKALESYQSSHAMSNADIACLLGIHPAHWGRLRNGLRQPGLDFLKAVVVKIPILLSVILEDLFPVPRTNTKAKRKLLKENYYAGLTHLDVDYRTKLILLDEDFLANLRLLREDYEANLRFFKENYEAKPQLLGEE